VIRLVAELVNPTVAKHCSPTHCPSSLCAHKPTPPDVGFVGLFPNIQKERIQKPQITERIR
jgi:hypothetical protein